MKNDFVMPIVVLTLICLVVAGAIAATNSVTEPIILTAAEARAEAARYDMIPEATGFEEESGVQGLPDSVREIYRAKNNAEEIGFIFMLVVGGYGGDIPVICAIGPDGRLISAATLSHSETRGLGTKIDTDEQFAGQFANVDRGGLEGVSAITGATLSSNAFISAIEDAFAAFETVGGMR